MGVVKTYDNHEISSKTCYLFIYVEILLKRRKGTLRCLTITKYQKPAISLARTLLRKITLEFGDKYGVMTE